MPIAIAIIKGHPVCLAHFVGIVESDPGLTLAGTATSGQRGRELFKNVNADIYLVDLGLPDFSGLILLPEIGEQRPGANVMVITVFDDDAHIIGAIESGATGCLLKDSDSRNVGDALRDFQSAARR